MSEVKPVSLAKIKECALAVSGWDNMHDAWHDTEEDSDCAIVGHDHDGELYPLAVVDCGQYDQPEESIKVAKFYAAANPKAVLELVAALEALQAENENLKQYNKALCINHDAFVLQSKEQEKEITHWKANHADLKERLHVATHRTDLPSDRLPLFDKMKAENAALSKQVEDYEFRFGLLNRIEDIKKEIGS